MLRCRAKRGLSAILAFNAMSRLNYFIAIISISLMLPFAALAPYLFYGRGLRTLRWIWETGYWPFWLSFGFAALAALISAIFLLQHSRIGRIVFSLASVIITTASALFAMSEHRHSLLVVVFFLAVALVLTGEWLRRTLDLPYYHSRRKWWEAYPKAVPGIKAKVFKEENAVDAREVRVSNFGEVGCFVFMEDQQWPFTPGFMELEFPGGVYLRTKVSPVIVTRDRRGMGLRFDKYQHQDDWNRELGECLSGLRRSGYVSG